MAKRETSPFEIWLRNSVIEWLRVEHPEAKTLQAKADVLGIAYSVAAPFLQGEKGISISTASKLIEKIGGDWEKMLPATPQNKKKKSNKS